MKPAALSAGLSAARLRLKKIPRGAGAWIVALGSWALLSALVIYIAFTFRDRARLIRDMDNERVLNMVFTSLRDYENFGDAIESNPVIRNRVAAFAIYGSDLLPLYRWGDAPETFDESLFVTTAEDARPEERNGRYTVIDWKSRSVKFVLFAGRMGPEPLPGPGPGPGGGGPGAGQRAGTGGGPGPGQRAGPGAGGEPEPGGGPGPGDGPAPRPWDPAGEPGPDDRPDPGGPAPYGPADGGIDPRLWDPADGGADPRLWDPAGEPGPAGGPDPGGSAPYGMADGGAEPRPWDPAGDATRRTQASRGAGASRFFTSLLMGRWYYIDILHPGYWWTRAFTMIFVPVFILGLLALALYVRHLYLRNREYRERIESQRHLVVLGTAASTLAHEIKNPLLSIRLQTGILTKICPEGRDELGIINEEVERLSALTYRVNDYLREARGNPAPVDVRALVAETGNRLCGRDLLYGSGSAAGPAVVTADPERLRSVFENLIRNALESGGPPEEVSASVTRSGGMVVARVRDRGAGIAAADAPRVFDPFFTRKSTGTGIGLSISRRFVEAAGGTITLTNREGGGAEARVSLPEA